MRSPLPNKPTKTEKRLFQRLRYADEYRTTTYVGANGRSKDRVTYIGEWYCPTNDPDEYRRIVWLSRIAVFAALAATVGALLILPPPLSNKWYAVVLTLSVFPLAYAVMGAVRLKNTPKPMEHIAYDKSVLRLKHSAAADLVLIGLTAVGLIVYWILATAGKIADAAAYTSGDGIFAGCIVLAAAANALLYAQISRINTVKQENSANHP